MARTYSQSDYGAYQYALTLGIVVGIIIQFSDEKVIKHLFHTKDLSSVIFSTIVLKFILSIVVLSAYFFLKIFSLIDPFIAIYLFYFLLAAIIVNLPYAMMVYFDYRMNSKLRAKALILGNTTTFFLQLFFMFNGYDVIFIAISVSCGAIVSCAVIIISFIYLKLNLKFAIDTSTLRLIFTRSIPFTLAAAAHMIYMRVDILMIKYFMEYSSVAIYSISTQLMSLVAILVYPLQVSLFPKLLKDKDRSKNEYLKKYLNYTKILTWTGIFFAAIGILVISPFINIFFENEYSQVVNIFYIHMMSAIIMYNSALRSSHITIIKKGYIILNSQIVSLILNIILNYYLIPLYGLQGAAFSTFITITISLLISNYFFTHTKSIFWVQIKAFYPKILKIKKT